MRGIEQGLERTHQHGSSAEYILFPVGFEINTCKVRTLYLLYQLINPKNFIKITIIKIY